MNQHYLSYWRLVNLILMEGPTCVWVLPPQQLPIPSKITAATGDHLGITPRGPFPVVTSLGSTDLPFESSNSLTNSYNGRNSGSFWGLLLFLGMLLLCSTKYFTEFVAYLNKLFTLPPFAQQKAPQTSLLLAVPLSLMLNCSHAGHFV